MPVAEAALFTGFAHSLWSYNRENWQWDWQVQQACEFQRQNMAVSRYSLFREDIRDLAALTVNKMDSYLIVNTLKLGFIVTIFLNYDRTDGPQHPGYMERQVTLLFSVCFLTAFLFLLISIWLSMHASIVAQSFTTKMLLQAARIPVATDQQISSAVPAAKAYETNLDDAFRLPLQGTMGTSAWTGKRPGPLGPQAGPQAGPQGPAPAGPRVSPVPWAPPSPPSEGRDPPSFPNIRLPEQSAQGATSEELDANPHLKFYSFLMRNWQTFDLYSKVCMSIGTSTLLSGIAYYATFFSRSSSEELDPFASGWFCFGFMSVLAWWSVTIDVVLQRVEHAAWAIVSLSGPITAAAGITLNQQNLMVLASFLQGCWVWFLCGSALALRNGLPRRWRASLYIDILNPFASNSCVAGSLAPSRNLSRAPPPAAAAAASQLLQCLEALLKEHVASQLEEEVLEQVRGSKNRLQEVLEQVGWTDVSRSSLTKGSGKGVFRTLSEGSSPRPGVAGPHDTGFWLLQREESDASSHRIWVSLDQNSSHACLFLRRHKGYETSVGELMETAAVLLRVLKPSRLSSWTSRDAGRLAAYGGSPDAAASLKAFEAQFRTKGQAAKSSMGQSARRFFQASSAVVGVAWLLAPITSAIINSQPSHASETPATPPIPGRDSLQIDKLFDVKLPRSWFAPTSASCSPDAKNIAVTDGIRAFVTGPNISEMVRWQEPQSFCEGPAVTAVALSSKGEVLVARLSTGV